MTAETLHEIVTFLCDKPHVYGTIMFILFCIYILFIAGKIMRHEDDSERNTQPENQ